MKHLALIAVTTMLAAAESRGQVIWNELVQPDLSDDYAAPTAFSLVPGDNLLFGVIDGDDGTGQFDRDYFSITIPAGYRLTAMPLTGYLSKDLAAFIALQPGPVFLNPPEMVTPDDLLGWTLFGPDDVGLDLLPIMGALGQGFTPPLEAGTYTFWVQQTGQFTEWSTNFIVEKIPTPSAAVLGALACGWCARRRRSWPAPARAGCM